MSVVRAKYVVGAAFFGVVSLLGAAPARAHMMPPQQGTLNVLGDSVFQVVAVPVSALHGVDDDGDGRLSEAEVASHEAELQQEVGARFRLYDGEPRRWFDLGEGSGTVEGKRELVVVRAEHDERVDSSSTAPPSPGPGAPQLLVLMKTKFPAAPTALRLETDLFGNGAGEGQLKIRATRGSEAETAALGAGTSAHPFFHTPRPTTLAAAIGVERVRWGVMLIIAALVVRGSFQRLRRSANAKLPKSATPEQQAQ